MFKSHSQFTSEISATINMLIKKCGIMKARKTHAPLSLLLFDKELIVLDFKGRESWK